MSRMDGERFLLLRPAVVGGIVLGVMVVVCLGSLFYTVPRYNEQRLDRNLASPSLLEEAEAGEVDSGPAWMGRDQLGRSVWVRLLLGGAVSLTVGILAAAVAMTIGTAWGLIAGYVGGKVDAVMMRVVDVLYGLPYLLLVILLAVAINGLVDGYLARQAERLAVSRAAWAVERGEAAASDFEKKRRDAMERVGPAYAEQISAWQAGQGNDPRPWLEQMLERHRWAVDLGTLLIAIGGVSWLTLSRVVRGQVLSLRSQPFVEAARALGVPTSRILWRHVLPNLIGPVIVYTTLAVPQAILQESILSFLGIGVKKPLPSWGNLAADGLSQLNPVESHWWLLVFPCVALGLTLLALNFLGDGLYERFDPRGRVRGRGQQAPAA